MASARGNPHLEPLQIHLCHAGTSQDPQFRKLATHPHIPLYPVGKQTCRETLQLLQQLLLQLLTQLACKQLHSRRSSRVQSNPHAQSEEDPGHA